MVKVIWTDNAIQDLNDIGEYISKDSLRYAELTVLQLFESVDILQKYTNFGTIVQEFQSGKFRQIIKGNYRIVYQLINDDAIHILTVHNCARLISNTLTK
ncbi:type II toxin-antitoxin system RelE/ParE family toxin [uncultured Cytophaga sp.]|uniref:type II toxin-antitoxin system RelE/ParE family toxin n=1 Tax=uncultured Cytophaga sp. TaxID=160238 RepID=UPI00261E73AF|nr:type II toxin-antitoxin system RelE/ParE family toxin [uncultured Cytophaga sp.]